MNSLEKKLRRWARFESFHPRDVREVLLEAAEEILRLEQLNDGQNRQHAVMRARVERAHECFANLDRYVEEVKDAAYGVNKALTGEQF